ncbi:MAG TPA: hypothetical protein VMH82_19250, partial [Myxococcota bacterium]|nr:hypothetical protein [Myxococcota bacterium]
MRDAARCLMLALALIPAVASAGETWIDANPSAMRMAWREGSLTAEHEGDRPYQRITTDGKGNPN